MIALVICGPGGTSHERELTIMAASMPRSHGMETRFFPWLWLSMARILMGRVFYGSCGVRYDACSSVPRTPSFAHSSTMLNQLPVALGM